MELRLEADAWHKTIWKAVTNPATGVMAAIVVVLLAAWIVVQAEAENRLPHVPVMSGVK